MTHNPTIAILANSSIFSSGVRCILEKSGFQVIGEAHKWKELFEILSKETPRIILLNLLPYSENCIEWLERLRHEYPHIPVLLIIKEDCIDYFKDFVLMGITGFVYSETSPQELIRAIYKVAEGHEYFPAGILKIFRETLEMNAEAVHSAHLQHLLTTREACICKLFCNGMTYKEIGAKLYISPRTVESHKKNILAKLKIKSTADMVKYAIQHHLI